MCIKLHDKGNNFPNLSFVFMTVYPTVGWQEIKILLEEQVMVLCSALKWRVAIVAKQRAPMAKPARV